MLDPNISPQRLLELSKVNPKQVLEHISLPLLSLEAPELWKKVIITAEKEFLNDYIDRKLHSLTKEQVLGLSLIFINRTIYFVDDKTSLFPEINDIFQKFTKLLYGVETHDILLLRDRLVGMSYSIGGNDFEIKDSVHCKEKYFLHHSINTVINTVRLFEDSFTPDFFHWILGNSRHAAAALFQIKKEMIFRSDEIHESMFYIEERIWQIQHILSTLQGYRTLYLTVKNNKIRKRKTYFKSFSINYQITKFPLRGNQEIKNREEVLKNVNAIQLSLECTPTTQPKTPAIPSN